MKLILAVIALLAGGVYLAFSPKLVPDDQARSAAILRGLQTVANQVLEPLEKPSIHSPAVLQKNLADLRTQIAARNGQPVQVVQMQLWQLISQAEAERAAIIGEIMDDWRKRSSRPLDQVPGEWYIAGHPELKINREAISRDERAGYWVRTRLQQWETRTAYYRKAMAPRFSRLSVLE